MLAHLFRRALLVSALLAAFGATCVLAAGSDAAVDRQDPGSWCGGALWRLMTLSDPDRGAVDLQGTPTTIADIAKRLTPAAIGGARTTKFQHHVWRLRAVIDRYRIASNGEVVLILYSIDSAQ